MNLQFNFLIGTPYAILELTARLELAKGFPKSFADFFLCHSDSCQHIN